MEKINSLKEVYFHIEEKADYINYDKNKIDDLFISLRKNFEKRGRIKFAEYCQMEVDFMGFVFRKGELHSIFSTYNSEGIRINFPDINNFTPHTFEYLVRRFNHTKNSYLKSLYGNILFYSDYKTYEVITETVSSYLKMYDEILFDFENLESKHLNHKKIEVLECAFYLAVKSNCKLEMVKDRLLKVVYHKDISNLYCNILISLLRLILSQKKNFTIKILEFSLDKCYISYEYCCELGDFHFGILFIELGKKFESKLNIKKYNWSFALAKAYEKLAEKEFQDISRDLITLEYYEQSIINYKEVKNEEKVKELSLKYEEVKRRHQLGVINHSSDITEIIKSIEKEVDRVLEFPVEEIYFYISKFKNVIPNVSRLIKSIRENPESRGLFDIIGVSIIDNQGNSPKKIPHFEITKKNEKGEEVLNTDINMNTLFFNYGFELQINTSYFLSIFFFRGFEQKKITFESLITFMENHCWFFKNVNKANDEIKIFDEWKSLLIPPLYDFFVKLEHFTRNQNPVIAPALAIDSLAVKFEGLIRDLCHTYKIPVTEFKKDNNGKVVTMEKDLNKILYLKEMENIFEEDDLFFFKYVLVDQSGYNIRNMVAHSIFKGYSFGVMFYLILILLKIGVFNYKLEPPKK